MVTDGPPSTHCGRPCAREAWDLLWADLQDPKGAEAKMRPATAVGASAILILVTEVWACEAGAEVAIKSGKWEFWIVGSKMPEPPPGTQLPPSVRWGPEGMIHSLCISETNLSRQSRNQTGKFGHIESSAVRVILDDPPIHIHPDIPATRGCKPNEPCGFTPFRLTRDSILGALPPVNFAHKLSRVSS